MPDLPGAGFASLGIEEHHVVEVLAHEVPGAGRDHLGDLPLDPLEAQCLIGPSPTGHAQVRVQPVLGGLALRHAECSGSRVFRQPSVQAAE